MIKCWTKEPGNNLCCCTCRHHVKLNLDCSNGIGLLTRKKLGKKCICNMQIAWVCVAATAVYGYEQWEKGKHSRISLMGTNKHGYGCELHEPLGKKSVPS